MAFTVYNTATPAGSDSPKEGDDRIREIKAALAERLAVDHVFALTGTAEVSADAGKHNKITLPEVIAPTPVDNYGHLYGRDVAGVTELFWVGGTGTPKQLTSGGKINNETADLALAVLLAGDQTIAGIKTFSSLPVIPALPLADADASSKKYVDDQIAAFLSSLAVNSVVGTSNVSTVSSSYSDLANITYNDPSFVGSNVLVLFKANLYLLNPHLATLTLMIDGSVVDTTNIRIRHDNQSAGTWTGDVEALLMYSGAVASGDRTFKVQWKVAGGTLQQKGAVTPRRMIIVRGFL